MSWRAESGKYRAGFRQNAGSLAALFILSFLVLGLTPSFAEGFENINSFGHGPTEVYIFSDYFCHPCQNIEAYLERALPTLYRRGVQISFVDIPIYKDTPLFSRYFIYAIKKATTFDQVMMARHALFVMARTKVEATDQTLIRKLKARGIPLKLMDTGPVFKQWQEVMRRFKVRSTPTCIVVKSGEEPRSYSGGRKIRNGLNGLLNELGHNGAG